MHFTAVLTEIVASLPSDLYLSDKVQCKVSESKSNLLYLGMMKITWTCYQMYQTIHGVFDKQKSDQNGTGMKKSLNSLFGIYIYIYIMFLGSWFPVHVLHAWCSVSYSQTDGTHMCPHPGNRMNTSEVLHALPRIHCIVSSSHTRGHCEQRLSLKRQEWINLKL